MDLLMQRRRQRDIHRQVLPADPLNKKYRTSIFSDPSAGVARKSDPAAR
jgi:hypothetical protein